MSNKYSWLGGVALLLTGCQITEQPSSLAQSGEQNNPESALEVQGQCHHSNHDAAAEQTETEISTSELTCEPEDGVIEVIHPEDEVTVSLPATTTDLILPTDDVWQRVSQQLTFPIPDNKRIKSQRDWYLKHPQYMQRVVDRARPFLYYIVEQIEQHQMPLELVLLPIVESAYDPFAYSHGRAAGMWQFIPGTATRFGMAQNWWYDGRRDVIASTAGAIKYLQYLNKFFDGNWLHALAAYNSGEGRVQRAIKKNLKAGKPTDFWSLDLPRETRAYVPKLLALADILKHQEKYAFAWPKVENVPVIEIVDVGSQIDLAMAAKFAGMNLKELHALNPGFNRWATDPDGPHRLIIPIANREQFTQELANIEPKDRLNWQRYKIKSGDSLIKIAKKFSTTVPIIRQMNDIKGNMIVAGQHLMIPVALTDLDDYALSVDQRLATTQNKQRSGIQHTHKIQSGDTLWDISRKYKVKVRDLAKWNAMAPTDPLRPGKNLVVWLNQTQTNKPIGLNASARSNEAVVKKLTYTVKNGDSLSRIASKFNLSVSDITKWNNLNKRKYLQPGQKLSLYVDVTRLNNV